MFGASVQYQPVETTTLSLTADRSLTPSLFQGQVTESTSVSISVNQRLLKRLNLTAGAGVWQKQLSGHDEYSHRRHGSRLIIITPSTSGWARHFWSGERRRCFTNTVTIPRLSRDLRSPAARWESNSDTVIRAVINFNGAHEIFEETVSRTHEIMEGQSLLKPGGSGGKPFEGRWGFLAALAGLLLCFGPSLYRLTLFAAESELYSYILLMPFVSVYLAWLKRRSLPAYSEPARGLAVAGIGAGSAVLAIYWLVDRSVGNADN